MYGNCKKERKNGEKVRRKNDTHKLTNETKAARKKTEKRARKEERKGIYWASQKQNKTKKTLYVIGSLCEAGRGPLMYQTRRCKGNLSEMRNRRKYSKSLRG